jgi:hypothetical protein
MYLVFSDLALDGILLSWYSSAGEEAYRLLYAPHWTFVVWIWLFSVVSG